MNITFKDKIVLITGAAHGFGQAMAHAFAANGAQVWATDILADELANTAETAHGDCRTHLLDVTDPEAINALAEQIGHVDVIISNAGGVLGQVGQPVETVSTADWQALFDVNVSATFYLTRAFAPSMKARQSGRIVTISSGAGLGISLTGIQAYASAKAALIGLTRQLAHELGPWNITVNSIAPGFVRSNPSSEAQWHAFGEAKQQAVLENIALKRLGTAEDIANAALFFASDFAGWVSGQVLSVDGGK
ncbi:MAG: SDR family NAD(P)-dependent oxidoreductase [Deinococcota bacterium]